jgi:F420-dependent oxidoreductase-like protein
MRIGLTGGAPGVARTVADAQRAESEGFAAYALPGDSTATLALIGAQTESIRLLTAVVPIFGIHPSVLANQALMAQDASGGRFMLGIGLSHPSVIEERLGIPFDRPGSRMAEYLEVLAPLLRGEAVELEGEFYTYHGEARPGPAESVSLGVAALGPRMLRMAGELARGTILWMANARAVEAHVAPRIRRAAAGAGQPEPEVIAGLPVALTNDAAAAREQAARQFAMYGTLPSYRAILDRGEVAGPGDAALVGNEAELDAELDRLEAAGVTLFNPAIFRAEQGGPARTREYLADRARRRG